MSDPQPPELASGVPEGKVPILQSAAAAWRFTRDNAARFAPALALIAVGFAYYQSEITGWTTGPDWGGFLMVGFIYFIATSVAMCAFLRSATQDAPASGADLQFGRDELRYIGVVVALGLAVGLVAFFAVFVLSILFVGMAARSGVDFEAAGGDPQALAEGFAAVMSSGGGLVLFMLLATLGVLYAWFAARISLYLPATIGERRMMIFQTWSWTKGNAWRILAALVVTLFPAILIGGLASGLIELAVMGAEPASRPQVVRFFASLPSGFINAVISLAWAGLMGRLYLGLRPRDWTPED